MKSSNDTLIRALYILAEEIYSDDGVANSAIYEAANRISDLAGENEKLKKQLIDAQNQKSK
jgi:hypothetical protein